MIFSILAQSAEGVPSLGDSILNIIMAIVSAFAVALGAWISKYLKDLLNAKKVEAEKRAANEELSRIDRIRSRAKAILYEVINNFQHKEIIELAQDIEDKKITTISEGKRRLAELGHRAKMTVINQMKAQGIDLVEELSEEAIDLLVRRIVDQNSVIPGETMKTLMNGGSRVLINEGERWLESLTSNIRRTDQED